MTEHNEMELIGTALQNFDRVAAGLALLEKNYKGVLYEVDTPMGMAHAKAARAAIRDPRYEVERLRKDAKAPILALGKRLDAEATRITTALLTLETPIDEQIKNEEQRREREKEARAAAEAARSAQIQALIDGIRTWPLNAAGKHSALVNQMLNTATDYQIDESVFMERTEEAKGVLMTSVQALNGIRAERMSHEAEQARIIAEREELAKLRAQQEERDRLERLRLAQEEAAARAIREAEALAQHQALKAERDAHAAEVAAQAEVARKERAENDRIARARQAELDRQAEDLRAVQAAETGRIAAERAELERQQEALRIAQQPKPRLKTVERPSKDQIITVVAGHYGVTTDRAEKWIRAIKWEQAAA